MDQKNLVVVSHKGWDGSRVIGVFNTVDEALEVLKSFTYDFERGEELVIDIVEMGKLSTSCHHIYNKEQSDKSILQRKHSYDFVRSGG